MKKGILTKLICLILVLTTATIVPMQVLAETSGSKKDEYISELMIASNKDANAAKKELTDKGFTVIDNNLNDGVSKKMGAVQATYLGYKSTTDRNEAITDMRVMDMKGGYSVNDYENTLKNYENQIKEQVNEFSDVLAEFRGKFLDRNADGSVKNKNAEFAYNQLNKFIEDDSGKKIGDLFIEENPDNDTLTKIVVQGNPDSLQAIELLLSIGCSENWLATMANKSSENYSSAEAADALGGYADELKEKWSSLSAGLKKYVNQVGTEDGYDLSKYDEKTYNEWANGRSEEEKNNLATYGGIYLILDKYTYKGTKLSELFQAETPDRVGILYPIADSMSLGQLQTLNFTTLEATIVFAVMNPNEIADLCKSNEERIKEYTVLTANENLGVDDKPVTIDDIPETESVYSGVDRKLFAKDGSVALTDEAIRKKASRGDASFKSVFISSGFSLMFIGVVAIITLVYAGALIQSYARYKAATEAMEIIATSYNFKNYCIGGVVLLAVDLFVIGIFVGAALKNYYNPDYTRVPRAIVDHKTLKTYDAKGNLIGTSDGNYIPYYAVLDAEAQGDEQKYGDLNGWSAKQWNALYYTKDKTAGNPITTDIIVSYGSSSVPSGYLPLEYFGEDGIAYDINTHAYDSSSGAYIFYTEDTTVTAVASSFSIGFIAIAAFGGLVVGIVIMYFVFKKKFSGKAPENSTPTVA